MGALAAGGIAADYLGRLGSEAKTTSEEATKEIKSYMLDVMTRELNRFDFEKVFVQGIVCTGIYVIFKVVYHIYVDLWLAAYVVQHPLESGVEFIKWFASGFPVIGILYQGLFGVLEAAAANQDPEVQTYAEEMEAERKKDVFLLVGKPIFEDYWVFALAGIWGILLALEKRRSSREGAKRAYMLKLAKI